MPPYFQLSRGSSQRFEGACSIYFAGCFLHLHQEFCCEQFHFISDFQVPRNLHLFRQFALWFYSFVFDVGVKSALGVVSPGK